MKPPPIRYPSLWIAGLLVVVLFAPLISQAVEGVRTALRSRWTRIVEGPPVPESTTPMTVAGPIRRRVLVLEDGAPLSPRPGAPPADTIRRRMFADVYDVWPLTGEPTHYRIGNRRPLGWTPARAVLPWDTRLLVRTTPASTSLVTPPTSAPVLSATGGSIEIAVWSADAPWSVVESRKRLQRDATPESDWAVLLSRDEVLDLLGRLVAASGGESPDALRLRAITGRFGDDLAPDAVSIAAARKALPNEAFVRRARDVAAAREALSRINEGWVSDAAWSGLSFRAVPLSALP